MSDTPERELLADAPAAPAPAPAAAPEVKTITDRNALRSNFFDLKPVQELVPFNGAYVELRQPSIGAAIGVRDNEGEKDELSNTIYLLIEFTYVPGTGEKLFEAADFDSLRNTPFGKDMRGLIKALQRITGVDESEMKEALEAARKSSAD